MQQASNTCHWSLFKLVKETHLGLSKKQIPTKPNHYQIDNTNKPLKNVSQSSIVTNIPFKYSEVPYVVSLNPSKTQPLLSHPTSDSVAKVPVSETDDENAASKQQKQGCN